MIRLKWCHDLKIPSTLLRFSSTENIFVKGIHHQITAVYGTKIIYESLE